MPEKKYTLTLTELEREFLVDYVEEKADPYFQSRFEDLCYSIGKRLSEAKQSGSV